MVVFVSRHGFPAGRGVRAGRAVARLLVPGRAGRAGRAGRGLRGLAPRRVRVAALAGLLAQPRATSRHAAAAGTYIVFVVFLQLNYIFVKHT